ncbi:MAG: GNAT family N-acetyltransferase [Gammaproteobacteria bacterium]|nr:GNAT family N-acetyltransferase [Gammaproteobacteria bacterium]
MDTLQLAVVEWVCKSSNSQEEGHEENHVSGSVSRQRMREHDDDRGALASCSAMTPPTISGPQLGRATECEAILRSLPAWFGIEQAIQMYVQDTEKYPTFGIAQDDKLVGFMTLRQHFPDSWEVHCMAFHADARNMGLGTKLLTHCENWLAERGAKFLQVKTVAATSPCPEYAQTRAFYESRGFIPLEIFPQLWDAHNPALQCIKMLVSANE